MNDPSGRAVSGVHENALQGDALKSVNDVKDKA